MYLIEQAQLHNYEVFKTEPYQQKGHYTTMIENDNLA